MFFERGQKIVCVGGGESRFPMSWWKDWARQWGVTLPSRGSVYTVRETRVAADGTQRIRLAEIVNPPIAFTDAPDQEPWFQSAAFRPLVEKRTDISVFLAMLNTTKSPELVED